MFKYGFLIFSFFTCLNIFAQKIDFSNLNEKKQFALKPTESDYFKSSVGFDISLNKYYGDLQPAFSNPLNGSFGFSIFYKKYLLDYLFFKLNLGKRTVSNNRINSHQDFFFKSTIISGSILIGYNFKNLIKTYKEPILLPQIAIGLEVLDFDSKADLLDANKMRYNYWSDGTLRNLPETSGNKSVTKILNRDFKYETDIRDIFNANGNRYNPTTFAIPISLGLTMKLSHRTNFEINTTYTFLFSDLIDNISSKNLSSTLPLNNNYSGNKDFLTSVSLGLNYKLGLKKKYKLYDENQISGKGGSNKSFSLEGLDINERDIVFLKREDLDKDGISDIVDDCPNTPLGIKVNEKGCPVDSDNDGIFDYMDDEPNSDPNKKVNSRGIALSDNYIEKQYLKSIDSTGKYIESERKFIRSKSSKSDFSKGYYSVRLKSLEGYSLPYILNFKDLQMFGENQPVRGYYLGKYKTLNEVLERKVKLEKAGLKNLGIVRVNKEGIPRDVTGEINMNFFKKSRTSVERNNLVIRIQIGAFKEKVPKSKFKIYDIISFKENGLYKCMLSKTFTSWNKAAEAKINLAINGFEGVLIRGFARGKEISKQATIKRGSLKTTRSGKYDKSAIRFGVQVGSFNKILPPSNLKKIQKFGTVKMIKVGIRYKYFVGDLKTFKEASKLRERIIESKVISSPFIVASYFSKLIPVYKAQEILAQ